MNKLLCSILFIAALGIDGCDKAENVTPRHDHFFVKFHDGIKDENQRGDDVIETSDGGLLIAGTSLNGDVPSELLLIKTDSRGNEIWTFAASAIPGMLPSEAKSVIELPDGYVVGGTIDDGSVRRSILIKVNFDGTFADSVVVRTDDPSTIYSNQLSKVTLGHSGILVSGETDHPAPLGGGSNGYFGLYNLMLEPILKNTGHKQYFGLGNDDLVAGAYEVLDTTRVGVNGTRFLAFGSTQNGNNEFDFYFIDIAKDYRIINDINVNDIEEKGNQVSSFVTRYGDEYWMIGDSDDPREQIFLAGWEYSSGWLQIPSIPEIGGTDKVNGALVTVDGKGITVQDNNRFVIVGDATFTADHKEIYLARVNLNHLVDDPWPKTFGTNTSTYSASSVITLQDGSIVVLGTADLEPIKKIVLIKTGPDGQMSF